MKPKEHLGGASLAALWVLGLPVTYMRLLARTTGFPVWVLIAFEYFQIILLAGLFACICRLITGQWPQ
jgi:hypothetical protein